MTEDWFCMKRNRLKFLIVVISCFLFLLWTQSKILIYSTGIGNRVLELLYTICMLIVLLSLFDILFIEKVENLSEACFGQYCFKLAVIQIVAFIPMYTQKFWYGDDLWGFSSGFNGKIEGSLALSRPFGSFLAPVIELPINYFRITNGIVLLLFGFVMLKFLMMQGQSRKMSFIFSAIVIAGSSAVDCIAYGSVYLINYSLLISSVGFMMYIRAREQIDKKQKYRYFFAFVVCLFTSFCIYQMGTPIMFLMYMIAEKGDKKRTEGQRFLRAFRFTFGYGVIAVMYLAITKLLQHLCNVTMGQSARGNIILSSEQMIQKAEWFFKEVIPQALTKFVTNFAGSMIFEQNNMFYGAVYKSGFLAIVIMIVLVIAGIVGIVVTAYRKKSVVYIVLSLSAIPLAFWPFLILPESYFLTYYAICIILLMAWYICSGIETILIIFSKNSIWKKIYEMYGEYVVYILIAFIALHSNNYAENAWVNYTRDSYEYLANTIQGEMLEHGDQVDAISVRGNLNPYVGGREYVIFCIQNILTDLHYDYSKFNITQRDNNDIVSIINKQEIELMEEALGTENLNHLLQFYEYDEMYGRWVYVGQADKKDLQFLKECFQKTGQSVNDKENVISITLNGFSTRNVF